MKKAFRDEKTLCSDKLQRKTYKDPRGVTRTWESAERTTRPKGCDIDGVGIVAILEKETGNYIYMQLRISIRPRLCKAKR